MRGPLVPALAVTLLLAAGCGGDEGSSPPIAEPSTPASTAPTPESSVPGPAVIPPPSLAPNAPTSWFRFGTDGIVRVTTDGSEQQLVDEPVGWATSDGAGGVLFTSWSAERFGPTWWQPADQPDAVIISSWDDPLLAARLNGLAVAVGALPTDDCESNGAGHMVALDLESGRTTTLQCWVGGQDSGQEPDSFGGGLYVGVTWNAVHATGTSTATGLIFRDEFGTVVDHPHNPFPGDCAPCELTAALSPDGSLLAVLHRADAMQYRPEPQPDWGIETQDIPATLSIHDLSTGDVVFERSLSAGALPPFFGSWFDGRFVVLGPDRFEYPPLSLGSTGEPVRRLQAMLVGEGFDIETDGTFGPATQAAVETFHADRFGAARSSVGADTWSELGVLSTIIDTETGDIVEVQGSVALEVTLTDRPAAEASDPTALPALRVDGLGPFGFGSRRSAVESWLTARLGQPLVTEDAANQLTDCHRWVCTSAFVLTWPTAGISVGFADRTSEGTATSEPVLTAWTVAAGQWWPGKVTVSADRSEAPEFPPVLVATDSGIGLGSTAAELDQAYPTTEFLAWNDSTFVPNGFYVPGNADESPPLQGDLNDLTVADIQTALNAAGANLEVDGIAGDLTRAALENYRENTQLTEWNDVFVSLGLADTSPEATITRLSAGSWWWELECGALEAVGLITLC